MKLSNLFGEFIPTAVYTDGALDPDPEIRGICTDLSEVKEGYLFAAVKGIKFDGYRLCGKAEELGAVALLTDRPAERTAAVNIVVPNVRKALAVFSAAFYGNPSQDLRLVGITGTNGKTTVSYMLGHILNSYGRPTAILGTAGYVSPSGDSVSAPYTTPEPILLHKQLALIRDGGGEFVVMEVSSQALDQKRVYGLEFEVGIITNITVDHLDYHKSFRAYKEAKLKLLPMSEKRVLNADSSELYPYISFSDVICFSSTGKDASVSAEDVNILPDGGVSFSIRYEGALYPVKLALPGLFNVSNALAAFCAACALGIPPDVSAKALFSFRGVKGRCERVDVNRDFSVMIDFAHTPDGLSNILTALRPFVKGRLICVFGCGGDRDRSKRPLMGKIAADRSDYVFITSDNPRSEPGMAIINDILEGIKNGCPIEVIPDRKLAIERALAFAEKDDLVLIAGKGHEEYQIVGDRKIEFDERKIIKDFLSRKEDSVE